MPGRRKAKGEALKSICPYNLAVTISYSSSSILQVCFLGLSEHAVNSADEVMDLIESGGSQRSTGTTSANADSSRSHAVLQLSLKHPGRRGRGGSSQLLEHGRLTFIDLAGSERGERQRFCERDESRNAHPWQSTSATDLSIPGVAAATSDLVSNTATQRSHVTRYARRRR